MKKIANNTVSVNDANEYVMDCDKDQYAYFVRYRENDNSSWKNSEVMSKEKAEANVEFLLAYGYIAKVCVAEDMGNFLYTGLKQNAYSATERVVERVA